MEPLGTEAVAWISVDGIIMSFVQINKETKIDERNFEFLVALQIFVLDIIKEQINT